MLYKKRRLRLFAVIAALSVLIAISIEIDSRLRVLLNSYTENRSKSLANTVINKEMVNYLNNADITYDDLFQINMGEDGKVRSVEFDSIEISRIKAALSSKIQESISNLRNVCFNIPVGTLTGVEVFNHRGPKIKVNVELSSAVYSDISSKFISAGINQTLHQVTLSISADVFFVMPWYRSSSSFKSDFVIAETIIVGEVPDAFTNVIEYPGSDMAGYLFDYGAECN